MNRKYLVASIVSSCSIALVMGVSACGSTDSTVNAVSNNDMSSVDESSVIDESSIGSDQQSQPSSPDSNSILEIPSLTSVDDISLQANGIMSTDSPELSKVPCSSSNSRAWNDIGVNYESSYDDPTTATVSNVLVGNQGCFDRVVFVVDNVPYDNEYPGAIAAYSVMFSNNYKQGKVFKNPEISDMKGDRAAIVTIHGNVSDTVKAMDKLTNLPEVKEVKYVDNEAANEHKEDMDVGNRLGSSTFYIGLAENTKMRLTPYVSSNPTNNKEYAVIDFVHPDES